MELELFPTWWKMKRCHREVDKALRFALGFSARPSGVSWLYTPTLQHHHFAGVIRYNVVQEFVKVTSKSPSSSVVRFRWPSHHRLRSRRLSALSSDPAVLKTSTSTLHLANILKNRPRSYSTAHQFSYQPYTLRTFDIPQRYL